MRMFLGLIERICRNAAYPMPCWLTDARSLAEALAHVRADSRRG